MARSLSWLDRLHPIARTVANSARSHYDRRDLQQLFELQPRSAQQLMAALPSISIGRARLVEREALSRFLEQLQNAEDPARFYADFRAEAGKTIRRKLRGLVLRDVDASLDSLTGRLELSPGELRVRFTTVEELAEAMLHLAVVLDKQLDEFVARYEPAAAPAPQEIAQRKAEQADGEYLRSFGVQTL
jgi:hypothetical protein